MLVKYHLTGRRMTYVKPYRLPVLTEFLYYRLYARIRSSYMVKPGKGW